MRQIREVEAESISLVIASRFGLNTQNYSLSYIIGWSDVDIAKFRKNIDVIRSASAKLIDSVEKSFEPEKIKEDAPTSATPSEGEGVKKKTAPLNRSKNKSAANSGMAM